MSILLKKAFLSLTIASTLVSGSSGLLSNASAVTKEATTVSQNATEQATEVIESEKADYKLKITAQLEKEGWYSDKANVKVKVEKIYGNSKFKIEKVEAKIGSTGAWIDITDDMSFEIQENCTTYIKVTDVYGAEFEKARSFKCFDTVAPTLNAAVNTKRVNELNMLMKKLYEDNISGKLSDKRFEFMLSEFENEQDTLEISMENAKAEIEKYESDTVRADKFIELVKRYTDFSELTTPMLNEFVEKILVHEADYSSGERVQEVEIYLNFIGKFELPVKEPTADEIAEHEKLKARRAKKAEYNRRYMEKRRKRIAGEEQKSKEVTVNG